jgi:hypothetical protein
LSQSIGTAERGVHFIVLAQMQDESLHDPSLVVDT